MGSFFKKGKLAGTTVITKGVKTAIEWFRKRKPYLQKPQQDKGKEDPRPHAIVQVAG